MTYRREEETACRFWAGENEYGSSEDLVVYDIVRALEEL